MANKPPSLAERKLNQKIFRHKLLASKIAEWGLPAVMQSGLSEHERQTIIVRAARIRALRQGQKKQTKPRPTLADLQRKGITQ